MERLRWLKSYQGSVIGEEFNSGKKSAGNFVEMGYAEYVDKKIREVEKPKEEKKMENNKEQKRDDAEKKLLEIAGLNSPAEIFKPQGQVKFYLAEQPIYFDANGLWWVWSKEKFKWEKSDEVNILNFVEELTGEDIITPSNRTLILNSLKQECRKTKPKDIQPTWLQFKDEVFDVKTGEIFKATPDFFVTNPISWKLHRERFMETPTMDRIFEEWVGKEHVKTLYEILAYCLLPDYPIHRLFCFLGAGMNGKSMFLKLLINFVGQENSCSTELDTLLASRFEVTRLFKKLVCVMGETNFSEISKTSVLKKLTGGDLMGFEFKRETPFEDKNYAKILIATNNLPETSDKTVGFYRRWCIIDFPNQFSEQKDILKDIPDEEYECLALKSCHILKDLLENRKFHNEGTLEEREKRYEEKSNFLSKFIKEFCEVGNLNDFITVNNFSNQFGCWCLEHKFRVMSEKSMYKSMTEMNFENGRRHFDWMFNGKGGQARVWFGLKWKT